MEAGKTSRAAFALPECLVMEEGLPLEEVELRLAFAHRLGGIAHRVIAFYLQDIDARGLHQAAGCASVVQFAMVRLGLGKREAQQLLCAGKALRELRAIDAAFADGRLCWSKVRLMAGRVALDHEEKWLELALRVSIEELDLELRLARAGGPPRDPGSRKGLPEVRFRIDTAMSPQVYALWEKARQKLDDESERPLTDAECLEAAAELILSLRDDGNVPGKKRVDESAYQVVIHTCPRCRAAAVPTEDGPLPVSGPDAERIACDCGCDHEPAPGQRDGPDVRARDVSAALRHRVLVRDGHRCRCCGRRHRLQMHHIVPWTEDRRSLPTC